MSGSKDEQAAEVVKSVEKFMEDADEDEAEHIIKLRRRSPEEICTMLLSRMAMVEARVLLLEGELLDTRIKALEEVHDYVLPKGPLPISKDKADTDGGSQGLYYVGGVNLLDSLERKCYNMNTQERSRLRRSIRKDLDTVTILPDSFKTSTMRQIERRLEQPLEVWMTDKLKKGWTEAEIGKELLVSDSCVSRWIRKLHIIKPRRQDGRDNQCL